MRWLKDPGCLYFGGAFIMIGAALIAGAIKLAAWWQIAAHGCAQ